MALNSKSQLQNIRKNHFQSQQMYYSKTQANFFKAYAHNIQFINRLNLLMNSIQKRKILKTVQQVKLCNKAFRKYLNQKRITHLKIQDVIVFQQNYQKLLFNSTNLTTFSNTANNLNLNNNLMSSNTNLQDLKKTLLPIISLNNTKKQSRVSNLNINSKLFLTQQNKIQNLTLKQSQFIKKGFMTLLQKLQTLKKEQFTNQTKYLQSILIRQCQKLKQYGVGEQDDDIKQQNKTYNAKKTSVVEQIQKQQKINGLYPIIMKNIRQQTLAIQKAQRTYQMLMKS